MKRLYILRRPCIPFLTGSIPEDDSTTRIFPSFSGKPFASTAPPLAKPYDGATERRSRMKKDSPGNVTYPGSSDHLLPGREPVIPFPDAGRGVHQGMYTDGR